MRRYFWDFFGPNGEGTAQHFYHHLPEFFEREKLEGCTLGMLEVGRNHFAVYCDAPEVHYDVVQRVLRPKRFTDSP